MGKTKDEIRENLQHGQEWASRTPKVRCGTYQLADGIPNFETLIDRRVTYDWRLKDVIPEGEYVVEKVPERIASSYGSPMLRMWRVQQNGSLYDVPCFDARFWAILEKAEFQEDTPSRWLIRERQENAALEILDKLAAQGVITVDNVKEAYLAVEEDWNAEYSDEKRSFPESHNHVDDLLENR